MLQKLEFHSMGCEMLVVLDHPTPVKELAQVPEWFEHWENIFSRFRLDSELSRLNNRTGFPTQVSPEFAEMFELARAAEQQSDGLVTPVLLEALIEAGYDRSFETLAPVLDDRVPQPYVIQSDLLQIEWDAITHTIIPPPGLHLDFGGIVKGWAANETVKRLSKYGPVLMDAAGDIAVGGKQSNGEFWPVGVADPFHPSNNLELLKLENCGVATSGKDRRHWQRNGNWQHHIIDPRTSLPAETEVLAATVIAPNSIHAEWAAKTSLLLGSQDGLEWLNANPELAGLLILEDGQCLYSCNFDKYLWS
ncbi:MAG: FAD:protein FMN transferase [Anaerolineales bacterium]|nr:FAD:protein FMN transferase [Anaerolineales bacterium]NTW12583.1 FAD:protein FMN transferase [Anaerolineales bacterium]